jgi:TRAP-type mannitol/chloroaromatic compound transport system permease small subunit
MADDPTVTRPAAAMPRPIRAYVRYVDALNRVVGTIVLYMIFVMMGVLLFGSITRYVFNASFLWIIEMSQFLMAAYYLLGGGYSMQLEAHVRMDVFYDRWRPRTRAFWDSITAFCLVFYLALLLLGGYSSTSYALKYGQTNYSAWAPLMWPIKMVMSIGIFLMLLQVTSIFFKDLAKFTGREID